MTPITNSARHAMAALGVMSVVWLAPWLSGNISGVVCSLWHDPDEFHFFSMNVSFGGDSGVDTGARTPSGALWVALLVVIVAVVCILGERMARRWRFLAWALPLMIAAPLGATTFGLLRPDSDEARVTIAATVSILALLLVGVYWGVLRMTTRLMAHARA